MKINSVQLVILFKNQIKLFFKNYRFDIFLVTIFLLNLLFDIIGLIFVNSDVSLSEKWIKVNILIVLNSLLAAILTIYVTVNCFVTQIKNNIHKAELRFGYKVKNIYLSRVLFIIGFSISYFLIVFITSLIFFGFIYKNQDLYVYRLYISAFAWYAILMFLSIVVTLLLTRFLAESFATMLSTLFAVTFILIPALSGITSNMNKSSGNNSSPAISKQDRYKFLIDENYKRNLYHDLMKDETSKVIWKDFKELSKIVWNKEELLKGAKVWDLETAELDKIKNYINLVTHVGKYFSISKNQVSSWDNVQELHETSSIINEPIDKIITKLQTTKEMEKYNFLLKKIKEYTINFSVLKELNILYQLPSLIDSKEITSKYKSSDEYLFVRTLNVLFYKLIDNENDKFFIKDIRNMVKKEKYANIFNPFRHFNLMFQSIDYKNKFLFNFFGQQQIFYSNVGNINFTFSDDSDINDLSKPLKLKQNVPVETIYVFYLIIGSLLIWLAYLRFNNKIKQ